MKVVINRCYGGFSLSRKAFLRLREMGNEFAIKEPDVGEKWEDGSVRSSRFTDDFCCDIDRSDPDLVAIVEELGDEANGMCAKLSVVEIPDGVEWQIEEYDGLEHVAENHRTWY